MFGRNYKPKYSNTHEDYTQRVREMLESSLYVKLLNEQPYNTYTNNGVTTEHNTEHYTMFYRLEWEYTYSLQEKADMWDILIKHRGAWYTIQEAWDVHKSIDIPHFHLIKIIE